MRCRPFQFSGWPFRAFGLVLVLALFAGAAEAKRPKPEVQVQEAYMEIRTGPGRGFPVYQVAERGQWVTLLKRKTDWFKVRTEDDVVGWVDRRQIAATLDAAGVAPTFRDIALDDFFDRRTEFGFAGGDFDGDTVFTFRGGLHFTEYFSAEGSLSQVSGRFSSSTLYHGNLLMQPWPRWRFSPHFTLGLGRFKNEPRGTLVDANDTEDWAANAGLGIRVYITRRFMLRGDVKEYVVMVDDDSNEDFTEWVAGFSVFF